MHNRNPNSNPSSREIFLRLSRFLGAFGSIYAYSSGTPREKLHWAFRLYDSDGSETIEEEELEDVFVHLCKIAQNIETAQYNARNPQPKKPPTPPPEPEPEPEVEEKGKKVKKNAMNVKKLANQAALEVNVKTMSNKLTTKQNKTKAKADKVKAAKGKAAKEKAAKEKARLEAEAAAEKARLEAEKAALEAEQESDDSEDDEPKFDPKENARATFRYMDVNSDGQLSEDEFVEGCLGDPMFLMMLETFNCDFLWGDGIC